LQRLGKVATAWLPRGFDRLELPKQTEPAPCRIVQPGLVDAFTAKIGFFGVPNPTTQEGEAAQNFQLAERQPIRTAYFGQQLLKQRPLVSSRPTPPIEAFKEILCVSSRYLSRFVTALS